MEVGFDSNPKAIIPDLKKEKWVHSISQDGKNLRIWLSDDSVVKNNTALKFLLSKKIGITKYTQILPETEDLFIKLLEDKS